MIAHATRTRLAALIGEESRQMVQASAVLFQPGLGCLRCGAKSFADRPEAVGVVHFLEMGHLMGGYIVKDEGGRHDQPPGEGEHAPR